MVQRVRKVAGKAATASRRANRRHDLKNFFGPDILKNLSGAV